MELTSNVTFAVKLPLGGDSTPEDVVRIATAAEDSGFDAAWSGEHVVFTGDLPDDYPYSSSGESPFGITQNAYDVFQVLAHLVARTDDIRIGTNVCIAPLRHPVALTKQVLTLDAISEGRLDFGVGVGWLDSEFDALGVPFDERGSRTDEFLDVFTRACSTGQFAFDGPHHSFSETGFHPRPVQPGGPPVWVGGQSGAAYRRVAEYGDGWAATTLSPDEVADARKRIGRAWSDYDRDGEPAIAIKQSAHVGASPDGLSRPMVGSVDDVISDVEAYRAAGAGTIVADFRRTDDAPSRRFTTAEQVEQIERFGAEVIPHIQE